MHSVPLFRLGLAVVLVFLQVFQLPTLAFARTPAKKLEQPKKSTAKSTKARRAVPAKRSATRSGKHVRRRLKSTKGRRAAIAKAHRKTDLVRRAKRLRAARAASPQPGVRGLSAQAAYVADLTSDKVLFAKNAERVLPIASITKLMTALVVVEAKQPLDELLTVTRADVDRLKYTSSRLRVGSTLTRADMLHIALMSSENRAASALGRHYPGGQRAFVRAMNAKARALGMTRTRFVEPTGLSSDNVSSPEDLARLVAAASRHPLIREFSTYREYDVEPGGRRLHYRNSNRLISNAQWDIDLQKTGFISEAGRCLVMQTVINHRPVVMVLLNAQGKYARARDATLLRRWLEQQARQM